jgi:hypothetical protein
MKQTIVIMGDDMTTYEDEGHFAKKHQAGAKANPQIEAALKQKISNGELPCAVAFKIASDLDVQPGEVGQVADLLELRLTKCQLGLFGYRPAKRIVKSAEHVSEDLEKAIRERLENGRLPCVNAWNIAKALGLRKMEVSSACETLGIKVSSCQVGAF